MLPLLYVSLFLQLGTPPVSVPMHTYHQEMQLIHRMLDPQALQRVPTWDGLTSSWRYSDIDDSTPILILHLWAHWCQPCMSEFPIWRDIGPALEDRYKDKVRVIHMAIQASNSDMRSFLAENSNRLPSALWYNDSEGRIVRFLTDSGTLPTPATLLIDDHRVVRQAWVGSIQERFLEVMQSTERLVQLVKHIPPSALCRRKHPSSR